MRKLAAVLLSLAIALCLPAAGGVAGTPEHKIVAKGKADSGNAFEINAKVKNGVSSGDVLFETTSFGTKEGEADCVFVDHRRAVITGEFSNSDGNYVVLLRDRRRNGKGKKDLYSAWITGPHDCATAGSEEPFAGSETPIKKGDISVR